MRPRLLLTTGLLLWAAAGGSQDRTFDRIDRAQGLPGSEVMALHEDQQGHVWIGTSTGLARHEGVRIRTWYHDRKDPRSLSNNSIWDITAGDDGTVWIATDHGLCAYNALRGDFDRVYVTDAYHSATSANRIHRIASDGTGHLWLSTEDGIHRVDQRTRKAVPLPANAAEEHMKKRLTVFEMEADPWHHGVWMSTRAGVMFYDAIAGHMVDRATSALPFHCLDDSTALCPTPDDRGGIRWFSQHDQRIHGANAEGKAVFSSAIPVEPVAATPQFIAIARDGQLWVSRWTHDLFVFASGKWEAIRPQDQRPWTISDDNAKCWLQDRSGRIWIGTQQGGVNVLDPRNGNLRIWECGSDKKQQLWCAVPDGERLLLGTNGNGFLILNRTDGSTSLVRPKEAADPLRNNEWDGHVLGAQRWKERWLLRTARGIFEWDGSSDEYERPRAWVDARIKATTSQTTFIQAIGDDDLLIGTWAHGIVKLTGAGTAEALTHLSGAPLPSKMPLSIAVHGPDTWIGFNAGHGLVRIRQDRIEERLLHEPDSTGANYGVVRSLAVDTDGTLYIGTLMGGLGIREPKGGTVTWYTRSDGLSGDRIEQLLLAPNNALWIRTTGGLSRFDTRTRTSRGLELPHSLATLGRLNHIALDHDGSLLCTIGGYVVDLPASAIQGMEPPEVELTGLQFAGNMFRSWPVDSTIELAHDQRALSIEFGVPSYLSGEAPVFSYRTDEQGAWRSIGGNTRLDIDDLPIGEHMIQVRARGDGSLWSQHPLVLHVEVLPPFWATWWFRTTSILMAAVLIALALRAYVKHKLREQREAHVREQAVLTERMRIAGDMHDDLGAGLSALKLRSEMALRVERDPQKREQLGNLARTAGDLIGSMRQIIWTMNTDQSSLEDLVVYATSYARQYGEENGLELKVDPEGPWPSLQLTAEQRRNIFLILKEALHNVVKHARAGRVVVSFQWKDVLVLEVQDDGIGLMQGAEHGSGNGFRNMRKRAEHIGGSLEVTGTNGTRIRMCVPLGTSNERSIGRT